MEDRARVIYIMIIWQELFFYSGLVNERVVGLLFFLEEWTMNAKDRLFHHRCPSSLHFMPTLCFRSLGLFSIWILLLLENDALWRSKENIAHLCIVLGWKVRINGSSGQKNCRLRLYLHNEKVKVSIIYSFKDQSRNVWNLQCDFAGLIFLRSLFTIEGQVPL